MKTIKKNAEDLSFLFSSVDEKLASEDNVQRLINSATNQIEGN